MMIMYDVMVMFHYQCGAIILDINGSVRKYIVSSIQVESQVRSLGTNFHTGPAPCTLTFHYVAHITCQLQPF